MGAPFLSVRYVPGGEEEPGAEASLSRPRAVRGPAGAFHAGDVAGREARPSAIRDASMKAGTE
ncbi:MAG TPA: hypothetical protein VKF62_00940 [Planctomycetota bacterium]|nr:hypothetical protein [Planctomycetota bacterium]